MVAEVDVVRVLEVVPVDVGELLSVVVVLDVNEPVARYFSGFLTGIFSSLEFCNICYAHERFTKKVSLYS